MKLNAKCVWVKEIFLILLICTTQCLSSPTQREIDSIILEIQSRYSIGLAYDDIPKSTWEKVKYKKASQQDFEVLLRYLRLFDQEFSKYPKDFIKRSNLKWVVFVKDLNYSGQLRTAVPDYYKDKEILFLDFARAAYNPNYQRHAIHHEFYHMIEEEFNGDAYWKDPNWAKLNSKDFKYGTGGVTVQHDPNVYLLTHPKMGFINQYSMSGIEEDKAEIYASLFVKNENMELCKWIRQDDILMRKVEYMKTFLSKCCKDINGKYWINYKVSD